MHHVQIQASKPKNDLNSNLSAIQSYLDRGWGLVPLHDVTAGHCSCQDGAVCVRSAGKHPRFGSWQRAPIRSAEVFAAHPEWNVGIATGRPSGHWVLDWDPASADDDGRELHARLSAEGYAAHVETGSGGLHYRFALPEFEVRNRQGVAKTHRLPAGWDVRGDGGQVVAPPSVSAKGPYVELSGAAPWAPPAWLLDLIRPQPEPVRPSVEHQPSPWTVPTDGREQAYARAGIEAECATYAALDDGRRGEAAWACCTRLVELANLGGFGHDGVEERWLQAAAAAVDNAPGGGYREHEARRAWARAVEHVGDRAAVMPAGGLFGEAEVWPTPAPFGDSAPAGTFTFIEPGTPGVRALPPVDVGALVAQRGVEPPVPSDPVDALLAECMTPDDLEMVPNPTPLIMDVLDLNTTAWLIGKSGTYKSFVALDWAAHVGTGLPWQGRTVRQGAVLYIVAEGASGMKLRKRAWEKTNGPMKDVRFLARPVQADERRGVGEWSVLVEACRRLHPSLVIIDTQARVTVGIEENSNTDIGIYIEQADRIKRATGACVLTVHHIGRNGTDARGGSALDGAQDSELRVERTDDMRITLHSDKQKDQADTLRAELALTRVEGGTDPDTGRDLSSLVIVGPGFALPPAPEPEWRRDLTDNQAKIVDVLVEHAADVGLTMASVRNIVKERFGAMPSASFSTAWTALVSKGILIQVVGGQRWVLASVADRHAE